ncbi:hypothetical protein N0V90_011033 [Kalmusia sp. IMI 367209]|nr:hypothetical protein N0V90_011033 [Kalmusia sp. IMI 367209]
MKLTLLLLGGALSVAAYPQGIHCPIDGDCGLRQITTAFPSSKPHDSKPSTPAEVTAGAEYRQVHCPIGSACGHGPAVPSSSSSSTVHKSKPFMPASQTAGVEFSIDVTLADPTSTSSCLVPEGCKSTTVKPTHTTTPTETKSCSLPERCSLSIVKLSPTLSAPAVEPTLGLSVHLPPLPVSTTSHKFTSLWLQSGNPTDPPNPIQMKPIFVNSVHTTESHFPTPQSVAPPSIRTNSDGVWVYPEPTPTALPVHEVQEQEEDYEEEEKQGYTSDPLSALPDAKEKRQRPHIPSPVSFSHPTPIPGWSFPPSSKPTQVTVRAGGKRQVDIWDVPDPVWPTATRKADEKRQVDLWLHNESPTTLKTVAI